MKDMHLKQLIPGRLHIDFTPIIMKDVHLKQLIPGHLLGL